MMELKELRLVTASNIIKLRTASEMTQAELGQRLNYSDKSISKWERGEAIPDVYVLTQLAGLFGVSVDYLLSAHDAWEKPLDEDEEEEKVSYSVNTIIALILVSVMTIALTAFVTLWIIGIVEWRIFLIGLSVTLLTALVLDCVFKHARRLLYILFAFVLSLFLLVYFFIPVQEPWQLFLLAIPAEIIVYLGCNIRRGPGRTKQQRLKRKERKREQRRVKKELHREEREQRHEQREQRREEKRQRKKTGDEDESAEVAAEATAPEDTEENPQSTENT
mgnify:FL=1